MVESKMNVEANPSTPPVVVRAGKDTAKYWLGRVVRRVSCVNGVRYQNAHYSLRLGLERRREWFPLHTANQNTAATLACEIYKYLLGHGWQETLKKYRREHEEHGPDTPETFGDFFTRLDDLSPLGASTLHEYLRKTRTLISEVMGLRDSNRFRHPAKKTGVSGHARWLEAVGRIRISDLTATKINAWRSAELKALREDDPARDARENTIKMLLRNARALFSKKNTEPLGVTLVEPRPFHGFVIGTPKTRRYTPQISLPEFVKAADDELKVQHPDSYLMLWLALFVGLRRGEADRLLWTDIDFVRRQVFVRPTATVRTKTAGSEDYVTVAQAFLDELAPFKAQSKGPWVVEPETSAPKKRDLNNRYRAIDCQKYLVAWLRSKGIDRCNPIHELRKEFGSITNDGFGLHAAMINLRHRSIVMTSQVYADRRVVATVDPAHYRTAPTQENQRLA